MEDEKIIDLYWERNEAAITETSEKYGAFCHQIALNMLHVREDAQKWYQQKLDGSQTSGKARHRIVRTVFLSAAAAIVIFAVIFAVGITSSADWDNNAFGYLRRLFNAGLDVNEFSITPQEEETFVRGTEGFTMNGVSFSTCLTVKELLINGWEITGRAREAGDIDSDNNVRIFTDAYSMTDGTGTIIVYLNWEDASSGMMTKDCRVSSIDLGNCDSFITGGFELEGITREQLDYYNMGDGNRILCRYTVDMLTGDPVYDYWAFMDGIDNGIASAGLCESRDDPGDTRMIITFEGIKTYEFIPLEITEVTDKKITLGRDQESYTIPNTAVYSDHEPEAGATLCVLCPLMILTMRMIC